MNMQKLGTLGQSEKGCQNRSNSMITGLHAIHYANIREGQGGTVRGMVARLTYHGLSVLPFQDTESRKKLIIFLSGVTRCRSVRIPNKKTPLQHLAKPYGLPPPAVLPPEKILFHLWDKSVPIVYKGNSGFSPVLAVGGAGGPPPALRLSAGGCYE